MINKLAATISLFQRWFIPLLGLLLVSTASISRANDVIEGRAVYMRDCAACHGVSGNGKGPLLPALKTAPSDLRLLAARYGNPLPEDQIARFVDGRADVIAHGPRDMPVWGEKVWEFPGGQGKQGQVAPRMANLVAYLQSIQKLEQHASLR